MTNDDRALRLRRPDGNTVAYATTSGRTPTVAFLGGFRSDMTGTKAMALEGWARRTENSRSIFFTPEGERRFLALLPTDVCPGWYPCCRHP